MSVRPNILLLMADQLAAPALPFHGHPLVKAPHLTRLADSGIVFDSAYCNFPICAPSRFSMLSGRLPHAIDAYDNASEFPASVPTVAHYLTRQGYRTILCGKMHFIGPDQLHGYEERLTTDIYPADFSWTPDFIRGPGFRPTGVSMRPIVEAGPCVRSLQIDYDDEVEWRGVQRIYDLARNDEDRPFFLTISFTHPHPPFVAGQQHWDRYRHDDIDLPRIGPIPYEELDPHSQWLHHAHAQNEYTVTDAHVRNARHAYYGMISYVDDKIGRILSALSECGLSQDTVVVFAGDHGEMLGERGMWFKQTFFEWSSRIPLVVSWPRQFAPRRVAAHVSLVDLLPTLLELASDGSPIAPVDPLDGRSLVPLMTGAERGDDRVAISEYSSEGVCAASRMLRAGRYKYVFTRGLPAMLFDLERDPHELEDLCGDPALQPLVQQLHARTVAGWDPEQVHARILASQKRRLFLADVARRSGRYPNWSYQPYVDESKRFIRGGGGAGPTAVKGKARLPYVEPAAPDRKA
ncbi:MAG TPA: choline-sulfatase [Burkholderiaceae bacterium]|nr:choline-sulfatase [Burkholderiaceae bacterium]